MRKAFLQPNSTHTNAEYKKLTTGLAHKALSGDVIFKETWANVG